MYHRKNTMEEKNKNNVRNKESDIAVFPQSSAGTTMPY